MDYANIDTNYTANPDNINDPNFTDEYNRIRLLDMNMVMMNTSDFGNPSFCPNPSINIFDPEIKVDSRYNEQISSLSFIKNELINNTQDLNNLSDEEFNDFDEKYKNLHESIHSYIKDMKDCREKLITLEEDLKKKEKENDKDITLIKTFLNFVVNLKESTDEEELVSETFKEEIVKVCENVKENNSYKEVKNEYDKTKKNYLKYLKSLSLINNLNVSNLCSICIQNTVTTYYNPCGHTTCETCKDRLMEYSGEANITGCRCPICRVNIRESKKIYFS